MEIRTTTTVILTKDERILISEAFQCIKHLVLEGEPAYKQDPVLLCFHPNFYRYERGMDLDEVIDSTVVWDRFWGTDPNNPWKVAWKLVNEGYTSQILHMTRVLMERTHHAMMAKLKKISREMKERNRLLGTELPYDSLLKALTIDMARNDAGRAVIIDACRELRRSPTYVPEDLVGGFGAPMTFITTIQARCREEREKHEQTKEA